MSKIRRPSLAVLAAGLFVLCSVAAIGTAQAPPSSGTPAGYGVELDVTPMDPAGTQFMCHALITELPSGKVVSEPRIQAAAGRSAVTRTKDATGTEVEVSITVESGGKAASYTAEFRRGNAVVAIQKGALALRSAPPKQS